jgi:hypothetical protein
MTEHLFCYVAKAPCGHYIGAVTADPSDLENCTMPTLKEWKSAGCTVEEKPVSFVREGGLTFCECKR